LKYKQQTNIGTKLQPWRLHVEAFSPLPLIGDVADRSAADLAYGEGFCTSCGWIFPRA